MPQIMNFSHFKAIDYYFRCEPILGKCMVGIFESTR
eukprot:UN16655